MKQDKIKNALLVTNIANNLKSEQLRSNTHSGEGFYLKDGKVIPEKHFEKQYPLEKLQPMAYKGENSDRRKNWMKDEKSY